MKNIIISLMFLFFTTYIYAIEKSSMDIEYYRTNINSFSSYEIYYILKMNFWDFFNDLNDKYNTALKKDVFKKTDEYKQRMALLSQLNQIVKTNTFYLETDLELSDYNLTQGAFNIGWGINTGYGTFYANAPKSYKNFLLSSLPITTPLAVDTMANMGLIPTKQKYLFENELLIYIAKENAIPIEENRNSMIICFRFKVTGVKNVQYPFFGFNLNEWYIMTSKLITTDDVTLIIKNKETGVIVFQKSYKAKSPGNN